jgi:hypothetical protein
LSSSRAQARKGFAKGKTGQWFTPLPAVVTYENDLNKVNKDNTAYYPCSGEGPNWTKKTLMSIDIRVLLLIWSST